MSCVIGVVHGAAQSHSLGETCSVTFGQEVLVCFPCRLASMPVYFCEARSMRVMLKSEPLGFVGTKDATLLSAAANSWVYLFGSCSF